MPKLNRSDNIDLNELKAKVKEIAIDSGAKLVGVGSRERLKEAPLSGDMDYCLPGAQSCIIWAFPIPLDILKNYLSKKERWSYRENMYWSYRKEWDSAVEIAKFIERNSDYKAVPVVPNAGYRDFSTKNKLVLQIGRFFLWLGLAKKIIVRVMAKTFGQKAIPAFSLRYGGVAAGVGRLGWSGNLVTKDYGSAVYLGGVITTAPLEPDPLLEDNPCNKCKTCWMACPTGLFEKDMEEEPVIIGGRAEIYAKRNAYARCFLGCGGWAGLGEEKTWSTWTPDHLCLKEVPEEQITNQIWREDYLYKIFISKETPKSVRKFNRTILNQFMKAGIVNNVGHPKRRLVDTHPTCGACQAVCVADPKQRKELYNLLKNGGKMFVDEYFREYIRRIDENNREQIYYPPFEKVFEKPKN
jgi:epoxyqueuosine reductase